jgi:hypothetical protein
MPIKFLNTLQVDSDVLYVDASSNKVGIGTTTPNFKVSLLSDNGDNNIVATDLITGNFKIGHGYDPFGSSPLNVTSKIQFVTSAPPGYYGDDIIFSTTPYALGPIGGDASSERMRITAEGNVGIGTTSPYAKLDVSGNISLSGTGTRSIVYDGFFVLSSFNPASFDFLYANNNLIANPITGFLTWQGSPILYGNINTGSIPAQGVIGMDNSGIITEFPASEAIRIDSSGNVGIGTTNPVHKLHVVSSEQCPALFQSSVAGGGISLMDSTTADDTRVGIGAFGEHLCFRSGGAPAGNMRLTSDGKLGIGTTSPASKLHAYESSSNTNATAGITVEQAGSGDAVVQYLLSFQKRWVTGIDNSDSDKFKISQDTDLGVNTVMTFDSSSRVGIGTTTPSQTLDVRGVINLVDENTFISQIRSDFYNIISHDLFNGLFTIGDNFITRNVITDTVSFQGGGPSEVMRFSGLNVGIGVTNPTTKLDVDGITKSTIFTTGGAEIYGDTFSGLYLKCPPGVANDFSLVGSAGIGPSIMTVPATTTNVVFHGNVGIGTTSPDNKLEVVGNDNDFGLKVTRGNTTSQYLLLRGYQMLSQGNHLLLSADNTKQVWLGHESTPQELVINVGGNVGIGTTSPGAKLHVNLPSAGETARFGYGATVLSLGMQSTYGYINAQITGATSRNLCLSTNGANVGIGTTSPSYKLDVTGDGRVTGDFRCDTLIQTSDADLKDNIRDISLAKSNIRFKEYTLKNDTSGKKKYGVLADDIRNDYPELVHYNAEGQAGVDYISLLVKKVAELEASEKTMLTWRHYIGNTSYNTLYDSGATTAFPYAYSSIPAPYDMYLTSVTMINNPYSSYNKGPLGGKAQLLAYENGKFIDKVADVNYRQEPYASVTFDFADKVFIRQGNALQLRFQADGAWYYCNSTIILTKA